MMHQYDTPTLFGIENPYADLFVGINNVIELRPIGGWPLLLIDPPWKFKAWSKKGEKKNPEKHYRTVPTEVIISLPIWKLPASDSVCMLWTTAPLLHRQLPALKAWGFCCGVGTRILTADLHWRRAEHLQIGDRLLSFDDMPRGRRRYYKWGTVVSTGITPLPCYRITLADGRSLIASAEHKWLARGGDRFQWATAHQMKTNRNKQRIQPWALVDLMPVREPENTYDAGFLSAAFDSEGSFGLQKSNLSFAQRPNVLMDRVRSLLNARLFKFREYYYPHHHSCAQLTMTSRRDAMRFLMQFRPPRLMEKWQRYPLEKTSVYNSPCIDVAYIEDMGIQEVVTLQTDVGTYIAEGFGAHNTYKSFVPWFKASPASADDIDDDDWNPSFGGGYLFRNCSELMLIGTRGDPQLKPERRALRGAFFAPLREHSRKPDEQYTHAEALTRGPYLELFSRTNRQGWDSWGDEAGMFGETT
jgi:N6-adenosine-specific RNA methylase IME4